MMHRCSGSMVGPCSCGLFHNQTGTTSSSAFSMLFPDEYSENMYCFAPSSVDCTLSLGTPSTRLINDDNHEKRSSVYSNNHERRRSSSNCMSNFWDILHPKQHLTTPPSAQYKSTRAPNNNSTTTTTDPLVARRCANCDTTSTPLWRNGPRGPKSLCNACGIRFKKEERRASAATATANGGGGMETTTHKHWVHHHHHSQPTKMPCFSSASYGNDQFRFIEDNEHHRDSDATATGIPFFPWRLNVADRPSLVHDFTR